MTQTLIVLLVRLLAGLSADQWQMALDFVTRAATKAISGPEKRAWVVKVLEEHKVTGWAANLLTELAHGYARKKGLL